MTATPQDSTESRSAIRLVWIVIPLILTLAVLTAIYAATLLRQPGSGDNPYMDDVGEIQVALNIWGTIHYTGYPLYTMLGNIAVSLMRAIGVQAIIAPALYSLLWGYVALTICYALVIRLTGKIGPAVLAIVLLGLSRSVWIHNVIAEVYGMTLALQLLLLAVALWSSVTPENFRRRVLWLAFLGGIGVAHHRMVAFMAPGLIVAVLPGLRLRSASEWRSLAATVLIGIALALIGFLPYLYLPARALAGSEWVYGFPGTWPGFVEQFFGQEAGFLVKPPADLNGLIQNIRQTVTVIGTEMTPVLAPLGVIALLVMAIRTRFWHPARIILLSAVGYVLFLFIFHRAVMPEAVAMFVSAAISLGLALSVCVLPSFTDPFALRAKKGKFIQNMSVLVTAGLAVAVGIVHIAAHQEFIARLTGDPVGVQAIERARYVPRDQGRAVLMLPWSSRFTAVGFSKYVSGENADLTLARHTANFRELYESGRQIYTFQEVQFRYPLDWWIGQIGQKLAPTGLDHGLIAIGAPRIAPSPQATTPVAHGVALREAAFCRVGRELRVHATWYAERQPDRDLSVFVHAIGPDSLVPLSQADSSAPVYGWYPTARWSAGEMVSDSYALPWPAEAIKLSLGLYIQIEPGKFENYPAYSFDLLQPIPNCEK